MKDYQCTKKHKELSDSALTRIIVPPSKISSRRRLFVTAMLGSFFATMLRQNQCGHELGQMMQLRYQSSKKKKTTTEKGKAALSCWLYAIYIYSMFSARPLQQTNGSQWPICTSSIKQPTMFWFHGQFCPGLRAAALPTREICHNLGKERQRRRGRQRKNTLRYKGCWQGQLVTGHSFHVLSSSQSGKI